MNQYQTVAVGAFCARVFGLLYGAVLQSRGASY